MGFIFVALGGAVGAIMRYSISLLPDRTCFPILTLVTNIIGAIVIGFIVGLAEEKQVSSNAFLKLVYVVGLRHFLRFHWKQLPYLIMRSLFWEESILY